MKQNRPDLFNSFRSRNPSAPETVKKLSFECLTTQEIISFSKEKQTELKRELNHLFPTIFKEKKDWEYMVRHFFYTPKGNTIREAVFARDKQGELVALAAFDNGIFSVEQKEVNIIYIHIRAVLPEYREYRIGRIISKEILRSLKPDILFTTCVQLSSYYSWTRITDREIVKNYQFFPRVDTVNHFKKTVCLPIKNLDFILRCFRRIYTNHVKDDRQKLEDVVNNITVKMVRKGVDTHFNYPKWDENNKKSKIAEDLGVTEKDAILLVIIKNADE